jgi:hypothetical protein
LSTRQTSAHTFHHIRNREDVQTSYVKELKDGVRL